MCMMSLMLKRLTAIAAVLAGVALMPAPALAKSCSAGYKHASIGGEQKCLRHGEFCSNRYASQYKRYGYACIWYSGGYHLKPR